MPSALFRALCAVFNSDGVLGEEMDHPLFVALFGLAGRRLIQVHDHEPHDANHELGLFKRTLRAWQLRRAHGLIAFSQNVAKHLRARFPEKVVSAAQLLSEMPDSYVDAPREHATRKHFLFIGRLYPYKNVGLVQEVARTVLSGTGEELHVLGSGPETVRSDDVVKHLKARFEFAELAVDGGGYRAMLMPYTSATQSGVQLVAAQLGLPCILTRTPGLMEYANSADLMIDFESARLELEEAIVTVLSWSQAEQDKRSRIVYDHYIQTLSHAHAGEAFVRSVESMLCNPNAPGGKRR
ncbi:glycosyltransferase [Quadrisphaera oryzae]|uniref:glycosyltransferase n=1 Tax=Quadrisphaera TaxID=317661 RepID=UPI0016494121|nr:glycosyltransferase [Quadrisphaera sp. RL12-1S]MBC3761746.1 hypothetical protein [Quadrisphaera sp. RL12-1S]